jgi:hypothetical protein
MTHNFARPLGMLERFKTFSFKVRELWTVEASLAANVGSVAAGPNQQGHIELHKKNSSMC